MFDYIYRELRMIDIPTIAELTVTELFMLITHIIIAFTIIVHVSFVYIQGHGGIIPEQTSSEKQISYTLKPHELIHIALALFALIHIAFLTTYLFGFNIGIMLEIDLLIIFITVIMKLKEKKPLALLAVLFLLFSFITIKGPFYQLLSQLF